MESLQTKVFSCISSSNPIPRPKFNNFTVIKQVGYAPLWRRRSRSGGCLRFRASVSGGGHGTSQDGYSAVEDEEKEEKGLLLGRDRDSSGSVVAFHLIPQSGLRSSQLPLSSILGKEFTNPIYVERARTSEGGGE
ncbi:soluble starch synthase 1, chloroplastic/amyloplastic isoform X1 [Fagus crenata]